MSGKKLTVLWHVDDLKNSHVESNTVKTKWSPKLSNDTERFVPDNPQREGPRLPRNVIGLTGARQGKKFHDRVPVQDLRRYAQITQKTCSDALRKPTIWGEKNSMKDQQKICTYLTHYPGQDPVSNQTVAAQHNFRCGIPNNKGERTIQGR